MTEHKMEYKTFLDSCNAGMPETYYQLIELEHTSHKI